jgi:GntR family carbon starvation induced transcriptional regulator
VEFEANRGFRVAPLTRDDLVDIATTRRAVEVEALRLSMEQGDDAWRRAWFRRCISIAAARSIRSRPTRGLKAWEEAHDALHAMIGGCNSPRLLDMQRRLQDQHLRYRRLIVIPQVREMLISKSMSDWWRSCSTAISIRPLPTWCST